MKLKIYFILVLSLVLAGAAYAYEIDTETSSYVLGDSAGNIDAGYDENWDSYIYINNNLRQAIEIYESYDYAPGFVYGVFLDYKYAINTGSHYVNFYCYDYDSGNYTLFDQNTGKLGAEPITETKRIPNQCIAADQPLALRIDLSGYNSDSSARYYESSISYQDNPPAYESEDPLFVSITTQCYAGGSKEKNYVWLSAYNSFADKIVFGEEYAPGSHSSFSGESKLSYIKTYAECAAMLSQEYISDIDYTNKACELVNESIVEGTKIYRCTKQAEISEAAEIELDTLPSLSYWDETELKISLVDISTGDIWGYVSYINGESEYEKGSYDSEAPLAIVIEMNGVGFIPAGSIIKLSTDTGIYEVYLPELINETDPITLYVSSSGATYYDINLTQLAGDSTINPPQCIFESDCGPSEICIDYYCVPQKPLSPAVEIDSSLIWNYQGYYTGRETALFVDAFNDAIDNCIPDSEGICDIPVTITSEGKGVVTLSNLYITYENPLCFGGNC